MASRTTVETDRSSTPRVSIEKTEGGQYLAEVRIQTSGNKDFLVDITSAELLTIGTAAERSAVLSWLTKAYNFATNKAGFA